MGDVIKLPTAATSFYTIRRAGKTVWEETVPYAHTFGDVPVGRNLMFINSSGYVSMAVNQGNFANIYSIDSGRDWTLSVRRKKS